MVGVKLSGFEFSIAATSSDMASSLLFGCLERRSSGLYVLRNSRITTKSYAMRWQVVLTDDTLAVLVP